MRFSTKIDTSFIAFCLICQRVLSLNIAVISDIHVNLAYDPTVSAKDDCKFSQTLSDDIFAPLGRYGCDPPLETVDYLLHRMNDKFGEVDLVMAVGDFVGHGIDPARGEGSPEAYATEQQYIETASELVASYYPDTPIIYAIGNNDS